MSLHDDGGPAFPVLRREEELYEDRYRTIVVTHGGMSLREFFASAALPAVMAARVALVNADLAADLNQESIAEECFELADAMLAERKNNKET